MAHAPAHAGRRSSLRDRSRPAPHERRHRGIRLGSMRPRGALLALAWVAVTNESASRGPVYWRSESDFRLRMPIIANDEGATDGQEGSDGSGEQFRRRGGDRPENHLE